MRKRKQLRSRALVTKRVSIITPTNPSSRSQGQVQVQGESEEVSSEIEMEKQGRRVRTPYSVLYGTLFFGFGSLIVIIVIVIK